MVALDSDPLQIYTDVEEIRDGQSLVLIGDLMQDDIQTSKTNPLKTSRD